MAALEQVSRVAARFCHRLPFRSNVILCRAQKLKKTTKPFLLLATAALTPKKEPKLEVPDASKLSTEYLIKSSSIGAVEQANNLITYIATGLDKAEKQYAEAIFALVILMEYKLQVLGHKAEEDRIWTLILEARSLVNKTHQTKQDLEMMMMSAVSMVNSAAEVAYMAGEEFSGNCAGDRLIKVETFLKHSKFESEKAEQRLRAAEAKTVEVESKHAEEQERKKENEKADRKKEMEENQKSEEASDKEVIQNISDNSKGDETNRQEELNT